MGNEVAIDLRQYWRHEARDFTPWLAREDNLARLSLALGMELVLKGTEVPVGPFRADIVAEDRATGTRVLIENQLEKSNHDHLGKALTYAPKVRAGAIVWIARAFAREHLEALANLNVHAGKTLGFYAVEVGLWATGGTDLAPTLRVLLDRDGVREGAQQLRQPTLSARRAPQERSRHRAVQAQPRREAGDDPSAGDANEIARQFWTGYRDFGVVNGAPFVLPKPLARRNYTTATGRSLTTITAYLLSRERRLRCHIYMRGQQATTTYEALMARRADIDRAFGALDWEGGLSGQEGYRISAYLENVDPADEAARPYAYRWLLDAMTRFHATFGPIVRAA